MASIANNRFTPRSQTFTYDELNRIKTAQSAATSGTDCWGLSFGYDIWANLLTATTTKCAPPNLNVGVNTKNQINNSGFTYDAAGNLTADGTYTFQWDAESSMKSLNGGDKNHEYTYDALFASRTLCRDGDGKRVKKSNGKLYWYSLGARPAGRERPQRQPHRRIHFSLAGSASPGERFLPAR